MRRFLEQLIYGSEGLKKKSSFITAVCKRHARQCGYYKRAARCINKYLNVLMYTEYIVLDLQCKQIILEL